MSQFSDKEIIDQVHRICESRNFRRSERMVGFLNYIISQFLEGKADQIKAWTIAVAVFDRPIDLDIQTDSIVRVYGGKLRRALKEYYEREGKDDHIIISIPKGGYQPIILGKDTLETLSTDQAKKSLSEDQKKSTGLTPTIEVYPFTGLINDDQYAYFSLGLTDEIIVALTRYSPLKVLGPMDQSMDNPVEIRKNTEKHNAFFTLRGNVQLINHKLKITATLSRTNSGQTIWGKTYKYCIEEFSLDRIEEELASQLTSEIADGLGVIFRRLYKDSYSQHIKLCDLTTAVLKYNHAWMTQHPKDWGDSLEAINTALTVHPQNSLLLALKSNVYYAEAMQMLGIVENAEEEMESIATKAISLDADLQVAQYNMVVQHAYHGRLKKCIEQAKKVVAMNPNRSRILAGCAVATVSVGSYEQALDYIERAKKLNPHYPGWYHFIDFLVAYVKDDYEKAWIEIQKVHVDGQYLHPLLRAAILGTLGKFDEAKPYLEELLALKPDFVDNPFNYLYPLLVTEKHVDLFWDGLNKAWQHCYQSKLPNKSSRLKVNA